MSVSVRGYVYSNVITSMAPLQCTRHQVYMRACFVCVHSCMCAYLRVCVRMYVTVRVLMCVICAFVYVYVPVLRVCRFRCLYVCVVSACMFSCICVSSYVSVVMFVYVCSISHIRDVSERRSQSY